MDQVATQPLQGSAELAVSLERTVRREERDGVKVGRQWADFFDLRWGSDQQVPIFAVQSAQRANHIADVSAYTKLGHPPNIDGDLHRRHLTTERTEDTEELCLHFCLRPRSPIRIQREHLTQVQHLLADLAQHGRIRSVEKRLGDPLADLPHLGFLHTCLLY